MNCLEKIRVSTARIVTSKLKKMTMLGMLFLGIPPVLAQEASIEKYNATEAKKDEDIIFKKADLGGRYRGDFYHRYKNIKVELQDELPNGEKSWKLTAFSEKGIYNYNKKEGINSAGLGFLVSKDLTISSDVTLVIEPDTSQHSGEEKTTSTYTKKPNYNQNPDAGALDRIQYSEYVNDFRIINGRFFKDQSGSGTFSDTDPLIRAGYVKNENGVPYFTTWNGSDKVDYANYNDEGIYKRKDFPEGYVFQTGGTNANRLYHKYTLFFKTKPNPDISKNEVSFSGILGATGSWQSAGYPYDINMVGEVPEKKYEKVKLIVEERFITNSTLPVSIPAINNVVINKGKTHVKNVFSEVLTKTEDFEKSDNISNGDKRTHEYLIKDFIPEDWDEVGLKDYKNSLSVTGLQLNGYSTKEIEKTSSVEDGIKTVKIVYTHTRLICTFIPTNTNTPEDTFVGISTLKRENGNWNLNELGAYLALESNTKGFIITRNDNPENNIANPVEGMIVWDTTKNCLRLYSGKKGTPQWNCISQGCNKTGTTN